MTHPATSTLMALFAHPDDESFGTAGTLRRYSDRGLNTVIVSATRGEVGEISDPALATPETLGQVRELELREAAAQMGVHEVVFLDYRDGSLADAGPDEAIGRVVLQIRRSRPEVILTFDRFGGYGHPDHMAVHRLAVAGFEKAGNSGAYPEQLIEGLQPYTPRRLYATGFRRSAMQRMREEAQRSGGGFTPGGNAATIPVEQMGIADEDVSVIITLTDAEFEAKLRALRAHRTQMSPQGLFNRLPPDGLRAWLGSEAFVQLRPAPVRSAEPATELAFA